jgi:hypothetical protein
MGGRLTWVIVASVGGLLLIAGLDALRSSEASRRHNEDAARDQTEWKPLGAALCYVPRRVGVQLPGSAPLRTDRLRTRRGLQDTELQATHTGVSDLVPGRDG